LSLAAEPAGCRRTVRRSSANLRPFFRQLLLRFVLDAGHAVAGAFSGEISSSSFNCRATVSRFWVFWIKKTIKKVMIVVPVLMTSCHVSL
jgi:hypothetical protein